MTTDLSYPIGKFAKPTSFSAESRAATIAAIAATPAALRTAVAGLSDAQLDTPYRPGGWTVRQVVHHVADSHMNAFIRLKLALTEETPTVKPYAEGAWAQLADNRLPIDPSLAIVEAVHLRWVTVMQAMSQDQFSRGLMHPENGPMTVDGMLALYAWHGRHHVAHVTGLREREGM
jgi:uncharacterized damage-inducible protein DinB